MQSLAQAPNVECLRNWRSISPMRVLSNPMGYVRVRMRSRSAIALLALSVVAAGCGGGPRQDESERSGSYRLEVANAKFPASQSSAERAADEGQVRHPHTKDAPTLPRPVETPPSKAGEGTVAFGQRVDDDRLSDPERPVWVVDEGPVGGDSAATNTWSLGRLEAGQTKTFRWKVTAIQPGDYTIKYSVSPGLNGKAKLAGNAEGSFQVKIDNKPVPARVNDKGQVVRGEEPGAPKK